MKVTKNKIPENFSLTLAIVDMIPVVLFSISIYLLTTIFNSLLFKIGGYIMIVSGLMKVLWKVVIALNKKNIYFFYIQMRYLMPIGFGLILSGLIVDHALIDGPSVFLELICFPNDIFYLLFILGMCAMGICAKVLDSNDVKSNWIEQGINSLAQLCLLIGLLLSIGIWF